MESSVELKHIFKLGKGKDEKQKTYENGTKKCFRMENKRGEKL